MKVSKNTSDGMEVSKTARTRVMRTSEDREDTSVETEEKEDGYRVRTS